MYKLRRLFTALFITIAVFILYGCKDTNNEYDVFSEVEKELFSDIDVTNITSNIYFPNSLKDVNITYLSSNNDVITEDGIVIRGVKNISVEVFVFLKYKEKNKTISYTFTVIGTNDSTTGNYIKYYEGVNGLSGNTLKKFLHDLIDDHIELSYSSTTNALKKTDEDPNNPNNIILFYTGRSQPKTEYGSGGDLWDKEHVWAKSHGGFGNNAPAGTDLHHLRPTDSSVNNLRGSKDFDEGGSKVIDTYGSGSSYSYYDNDSFEPRDEDKGDVARILFYMAVRYEGDITGEPNLELNNQVNNGSEPYIGKLSVLLKWHLEDPVDDFERNRNEVIYSYQKNRNPFIDYPDFVSLI